MKLLRELKLVKEGLPALLAMRKFSATGSQTAATEIEAVAEKHPDAQALISDDVTWTYGQLEEEANRFANLYLSKGLAMGDVIALDMVNRVEYVAAWLGAAKLGVTTALINTNLSGAQLSHCLEVAEPKLIVLGAERADAFATVRSDIGDVPVFSYGGPVEGAEALEPLLAEASTARPGNEHRKGVTTGGTNLFLIYTSGTTGLPKAAHFSHLRFLSVALAAGKGLKLGPGERQYVCLPLYHTAGGVMATGAALLTGAAAIVVPKFSASRFFPDLVRFEATSFQYIGELLRYLVNQDPVPEENAHKVTRCIGNGLRPEIWPEVEERFGIEKVIEFYGATEGNVAIVNLEGKQGSVGRLPGFVRKAMGIELVRYDVNADDVVRGPDGFCIRCEPGEAGEAVGRMPQKENATTGRFEGYSDKAATEKKILRDVFKKGDAYFRTGDLLSCDEEGYFYFIDRIGDTFRWKGENVATTEVAEVLSVVPGVDEVNVYGVEVPGADGRAGMASVVPSDGKSIDLDALFEATERDLAPYARPLFLRVQPEIEVTGTLKHRKVDLVKEGYDPSSIDEDLYFRDAEAGAYVPLTDEVYEQVSSGAKRL
jgi:fatty-acyl-CoA synthase